MTWSPSRFTTLSRFPEGSRITSFPLLLNSETAAVSLTNSLFGGDHGSMGEGVSTGNGTIADCAVELDDLGGCFEARSLG